MRNSFSFFPKLALNNIKKNNKAYLPYLLACVGTATVYYIIHSLSVNPGLEEILGGGALTSVLQMGGSVAAVFACIFLFYTNRFLMKQRKPEFGVFNMLGMEKKHIAKTIAFETLYTYFITVSGGIILGIALDKLTFLIISKMFHEKITLGFFISPKVILSVIVLFALIFFAIYCKSVLEIKLSSPIELLHESSVGEKEPKANWLIALLGVITLGAGYVLALIPNTPWMALGQFFFAVILVIIGTYLLFTAGSIVLLKILKHNKNFYYTTNHFISVSNMVYRMKQNAMGLASICILSTMVLVMISSTGSLMLGLKDMENIRYPYDYNFYWEDYEVDVSEVKENIAKVVKENNIPVKEEVEYHYFENYTKRSEDDFIPQKEFVGGSILVMMPLSDYNAAMNEQKILGDTEVFLHTERIPYEYPTLNLWGTQYTIKEQLSDYPPNGRVAANIDDAYYLVIPDKQMDKIQQEFSKIVNQVPQKRVCYGFNTSLTHDEQIQYDAVLREAAQAKKYDTMVLESKAEKWKSSIALFGGMFFIGIILGLLFIMATVLIIYYKQISEGMEDRKRYDIMQKVGLSLQEVKSTIRSQILIVFFLPPLVAGIHICVAFPIINRMLGMFGLLNTKLFALATIGCFAIFLMFYVLVYLFTAKVYYRIVRRVR